MKIPILKLGDVLLASIQFELTDGAALEFQSDLIQAAESTRAQGVVVDITALEVVDTFIARVINDTGSMLQLVGARVVVCGIQPPVALTLAEMGRELIGVETALNLEQGLEKVRRMIALDVHELRESRN